MSSDDRQPEGEKRRSWYRLFVRTRHVERVEVAALTEEPDAPAEPEAEPEAEHPPETADQPEQEERRGCFGLLMRGRPSEAKAEGESVSELEPEPAPEPVVEEEPTPEAPGAKYLDVRAAEPGFFRIRERVHPVWKVILASLPFIVFLAWWFWATDGAEPHLRRISPMALPSPQEVLARCPSLWYDSALMRNILVSLARVLGGLAAASVIALPLGILMASFGRVGSTFGLVTTLLSYLPMPAIVPLTYMWWKTGEEQKVGFLALGTFAYLLPLVVRCINQVDHKYVLSAYSQGARPLQMVRKVLVPIALPGIYDGMRLCLGIGWTYIVLAEAIKASEDLGGVGNLIMVFWRLGHPEEVYLTVGAILVVGALMDRSCACLGKWLFPYRAATAHD